MSSKLVLWLLNKVETKQNLLNKGFIEEYSNLEYRIICVQFNLELTLIYSC